VNGSGGVAGLAAAAKVSFPHIEAARRLTEQGLRERAALLASLPLGPHASVVLTGSWGRREITRDSDADFFVINAGPAPAQEAASLREIEAALGGRAAGAEGVFNRYVSLSDLLEKIGLDEDLNANLTRRMLLILESVPVSGAATHRAARKSLLAGYLGAGAKDYRPPRFLLNDLIRYWRTIAVDFEGKMRARRGEGWGLRNAKLRLSRKALFAGGLLPVLECHRHTAETMLEYLDERMAVPPLDRIADAFLAHGALDPGVRALAAYDEFLAALDDPEQRQALSRLAREDRHGSALFARISELGQEFEAGLLALLFDDGELRRQVREYLIF
jgi:predicted nucleotidyltransferase